MMTLSMLAGAVASVIVGMLVWDTLPIIGADVPRVNVQQNLYLLWRFLVDLFERLF